MKGLTLIWCFLLGTSLNAQQPLTPVVSLAGIGPVKVGMKKEDLDKLIGQPLPLKNLIKKEWSQDTVSFKLADVPYQVVLDKGYEEKNEGQAIVYAVTCSHEEFKTKSGIGIGDDKLKIISTYEGYTIHIIPEYKGNPPQKSKTKATVYLYGEATPTCIIFYLDNNKVTGFCVMYNEGC